MSQSVESNCSQLPPNSRPSHNRRVVALIQEKLVPLNKSRYLHLQKINQALRKQYHLEPLSLTSRHQPNSLTSRQPPLKSLNVQKSQRHCSQTNLLLHKLKNFDSTQLPLPRKCREKEDEEEWEKEWEEKDWGKEKRLVERAEEHLRARKREISQEGRDWVGRRGQLEGVLQKLGSRCTQELERQLLRDIRLTLLEQKMNKLKREINHKKIVQMR